uniref:Uncharacterized protein n=1 Tax=Siphoviridae sp. ctxjx4 TaxID=2826522 RepID=A0A8S5M2E1_9CAUD|nr:MAG TPA: hypothetical protein [Siphoviridae sp. ctxjx4]
MTMDFFKKVLAICVYICYNLFVNRTKKVYKIHTKVGQKK